MLVSHHPKSLGSKGYYRAPDELAPEPKKKKKKKQQIHICHINMNCSIANSKMIGQKQTLHRNQITILENNNPKVQSTNQKQLVIEKQRSTVDPLKQMFLGSQTLSNSCRQCRHGSNTENNSKHTVP